MKYNLITQPIFWQFRISLAEIPKLHIEKVFQKTFFQIMFIWTRWMLLWQPCQNIVAKIWDHAAQKAIKNILLQVSQWRFYPRKFFGKGRKQFSKTLRKKWQKMLDLFSQKLKSPMKKKHFFKTVVLPRSSPLDSQNSFWQLFGKVSVTIFPPNLEILTIFFCQSFPLGEFKAVFTALPKTSRQRVSFFQ